MKTPLVVFVDVDDTLVRSFGSKRIPMTAVVEHVRSLRVAGALLYCWSSGGAEYARAACRELGMEAEFAAFLPKPNVLLDDVAVEKWPRLVAVHPNEALGATLADYEAAVASGHRSLKPEHDAKKA